MHTHTCIFGESEKIRMHIHMRVCMHAALTRTRTHTCTHINAYTHTHSYMTYTGATRGDEGRRGADEMHTIHTRVHTYIHTYIHIRTSHIQGVGRRGRSTACIQSCTMACQDPPGRCIHSYIHTRT